MIDPRERRYRRRKGTRVLVRAHGRVLLVADHDPGVENVTWWTVPGGGVDGEETWREAGVRELYEETGLRVGVEDLVGPLARRVVVHGYSDRILEQEERFFAVDLADTFEPDPAGFTEREKLTLGSFTWFTADQLAQIEVWPHEITEILAATEGEINWGTVEESTVPARLGYSGS